MGYTHYWTPKAADDKTWKKFVATCKKLHKNLPDFTETAGGYHADDALHICGGDGTGKPEFSKEGVYFNGNGDLSHETFFIAQDKMDWNFCKTARKPYDLLVVACLLAAYNILGYEVSSDGDMDDWEEGINFYLDTIHDKILTKEEIKEMLPEFLFRRD